MSGSEISLSVVAGVFGLIATLLTILTFFKNDKKDGKKEAQEIATMRTDLSYIKDGVSELKLMMQSQSKEQNEMKLKVQKIEDRVESIETRINLIEKKKA
jgi:septal ring factor EnvC (AmiA/AmiB activator)